MADDFFADLVPIKPKPVEPHSENGLGQARSPMDQDAVLVSGLDDSMGATDAQVLNLLGEDIGERDATKQALPRTPMGPSSSSRTQSQVKEFEAAVESTMRRFASGLQRILEDINQRLQCLEDQTERLSRAVSDSRGTDVLREDSFKDRFSALDKGLREVNRSVQLMRDKQELSEAQAELSKLAKKRESEVITPAPAATVASAPQATALPPAAVEAPVRQTSAPPPASAAETPAPGQASQQPLPTPTVPPMPSNAPPPPVQLQSAPHQAPVHQTHAASAPHSGGPQHYTTSNPQPPPHFPAPAAQEQFHGQQYSSGPPPQPQAQAPPQPPPQPQAPPHAQPPVPAQGYPPQQQVHNQASQYSAPPPPPPPQQFAAGAPPKPAPPPPPPPQSYQQYGGASGPYSGAGTPGSGGQAYTMPTSGPGPQTGYPSLAQSQPSLINAPLPPHRYPSGGPPPSPGGSYSQGGFGQQQPAPRSGRPYREGAGYASSAQQRPAAPQSGQSASRNVPLEQVIDDVANMGFSRHDVRAVVSELMERGQAVDLNVVLDRLMNGPRR